MINSKSIIRCLLAGLMTFNFTQIHAQLEGTWSGTMRLTEVFTGQIIKSEKQVILNFTNNRGRGTVEENGELIIGGKLFCKSSCSGSGPAEITTLMIDLENSDYYISATSPPYSCTNTGSGCEQSGTDMHEVSIVVSDNHLANPNLLVGSETKVSDVVGMGTVTTTVTWNLVRSIDVELIVTPANYDNWLPEPGRDEVTKGTVMNISLKLQRGNGQPPALKAKAFELRLSNSSKEPGITLNIPFNPQNHLPDLRFLVQANAQIANEFQFIRINCNSCLAGNVSIGAYDGGGWSTLTATAILEDDTRIEGNLLVSGGIQEIPIPKRKAGSNIATAWLMANGDPTEMEDKEVSAGNLNHGDGLSAYEEYRGVISEGQFRRLDPNKKELGVKMNRGEIPLFSEGISKFENAAGLKVIPFFENEIGTDRKLNKNNLTAHLYDQYALFLQIGSLVSDLGKSFGGPGIPKQISKVVFAQNNISQSFQDRLAEANSRNTALGYTQKDLFATVTAHELAHSVNVTHHGSLPPNSLNLTITAARTAVRIFNYSGVEILTRSYPITGRGGETGNEQGGDVNCFMLNNFLCDWVVKTTPDSMFFYEVPLIPLGIRLCDKKDGTGLNLKDANGNSNYFGDAANGKCLSLIKLR